MVGNPDKRSSKLVYILADQAEYRMLDLHEIPFVTVATTRNIISLPPPMHFGKQNNKFQFTFTSQRRATQAPTLAQPRSQSKFQLDITSSTTVTKRSRETAFEGSALYSGWLFRALKRFKFTMD